MTGIPAGLGELEQLVAGVAVDRAAADVEDRPRGGEQGSRRLANLSWVDAGRRLPPWEIDLMGVSEVDLRLLHVLGDVHEDRARSAGSGDVERRLQNVREFFDVLYEPRVLDDRERDAGRVRFLERVRADQARAHLAGDADERGRVHPCVGDRRDEVRHARPGGGERDADPARGARIALRHVPGALLVAGEHVPNGRAAREPVVEREDGSARDPEGDVDALGFEGAEDRVGAEHLHAAAPANSASRRAAGSDASSASMNSRVVAPAPEETMSGVRTPVSERLQRRRARAFERRCARPGPRPEHERRREQHRARVGDALAGDLQRRAVRGAEHPFAVRADAARRDQAGALMGERGRARESLGEGLLAGDHVEVATGRAGDR